MASKRSRMYFSPDTDCKDELIRVMLNWAFGGFKPSGVNGLRPQSDYNGIQLKPAKKMIFNFSADYHCMNCSIYSFITSVPS